MIALLRATPAAPDARRSGALAGLILGLLLSATTVARAQEADALPAATAVTKLTWSRASGITRLAFHGTLLPMPIAVRGSGLALRLDFAAADGEAIPRTLEIGTSEVASVVRIPASTGALPEGVSCRFVIVLARPDVTHSIESRSDAVLLVVGDAEAVGRGEEAAAGESLLVAPLAERRVVEQPPELAEVLERPQSIRLNADMSLRAAPSAIATVMGVVEAGQSRIIDARRGEWAHVQEGGWLRLPQVVGNVGGAAPDAAIIAARTAAAWSVITLGTNLDIQVVEVLPGDEKAETLARLYAGPIKLARFRVRVDPETPYAFRLPSKEGRLILELADGTTQQSLDPTSLPLRDASARARVDMILAAPPLAAGGSWDTLLVFPASIDFPAITGARVEVNGLLHRLFRVPGSGEVPAP